VILSIERVTQRVEPGSHSSKWACAGGFDQAKQGCGREGNRSMIRIRGLALAAYTVAFCVPAAATVYPMDAAHWDAQGHVSFVTHDGKQSVLLGADKGNPVGGGQANLKDVKFETGIIEYDLMITAQYDFVGPTFRQVKDGFGEVIYLRPHMIGKPDSIQYTPVINNNLAWQIFTGPGFEAQATFPVGKWIHVRTDVYQSSASVSLDAEKVLHIPYLKGEPGAGDVGVLALAGGDYIANFSLEPIADYRDPEPAPPVVPLPKGSVTSWQVSSAITQKDAFARAAKSDWAGVKWKPIAVETTGAANLSKAGPDHDDHDSFIARFKLGSPTAHRELMHFGFSDSVRVYLNGAPLYEGADLQGSRDYRFLGHVGFWDSVFLPLRKGKNEVVFVVTDNTNGGTAAAAKLDPGSAVAVR
jgi:hypothetical protein